MQRCRSARTILFFFPWLLLGCGKNSTLAADAAGGSGDSGVTTPDGATADADAPAPDQSAQEDGPLVANCDLFTDRSDLTVTASRYKTKVDAERGDVVRIMYAASTADPFFIRVTVWEGQTGYPTGPATVNLADVPQDTSGGVMVRFGHGCDAQGRECTTDFVGYEGTVTISSLDWSTPAGSTFAGELSQVRFKQVTFDAAENPVEVPDGCAFTLSAHAFSGLVTVSGGG